MSQIIDLLSLNAAIIAKCFPHLLKDQQPWKSSFLATAPGQGFTGNSAAIQKWRGWTLSVALHFTQQPLKAISSKIIQQQVYFSTLQHRPVCASVCQCFVPRSASNSKLNVCAERSLNPKIHLLKVLWIHKVITRIAIDTENTNALSHIHTHTNTHKLLKHSLAWRSLKLRAKADIDLIGWSLQFPQILPSFLYTLVCQRHFLLMRVRASMNSRVHECSSRAAFILLFYGMFNVWMKY